jgi:uncharacterized Zn finger protein
MAYRAIWVACTNCGEAEERTVDSAATSRITDGEVIPQLRCNQCGVTALMIRLRPWVLTENDRAFLQRLRIGGE